MACHPNPVPNFVFQSELWREAAALGSATLSPCPQRHEGPREHIIGAAAAVIHHRDKLLH